MSRFAHTLVVYFFVAMLAESAAQAAGLAPDLRVQPPSLAPPQRGSIAGSLSRLSYGPSELGRGAYSLPLGLEAPTSRGPLLAQVSPAYSTENGLSEWGMGWANDLSIQRHRVVGDLLYNDTDGYVSPWGRLVRGDDGFYYPAGLRSRVRVQAVGDGWQAIGDDGTQYTFAATDAVRTSLGGYRWMLSRVVTLFGDSTTLTWAANDSGRRFLERVSWGGRNDGTQYELTLAYEPLARSFVDYRAGIKQTLDRRVKQVIVSAKSGAALQERWRYVFGYTASSLGPAYYLASVERTYPSGVREPPVTYAYDLGVEQFKNARLEVEPALDPVLSLAGGNALSPERSSLTDVDFDGLNDLEHHYDQVLFHRNETGFVAEALPSRNGQENLACRPAPSAANAPRMLARMRPGPGEPQVVVIDSSGGGAGSTITLCSRGGQTLGRVDLFGSWSLDGSTRLADLDLDQRPDVTRVFAGGLQVLRNTSTNSAWSFSAKAAQSLTPVVTPAASWILDVNGDGKPDLVVRSGGSMYVWYGKGNYRFETSGQSFSFYSLGGTALSNLDGFQLSHGDFNGDGLSDVILTRGQLVSVYMNQGDRFEERAIPGLVGLPFTVGYPLFADLRGSGNPEVILVDNQHAKSIALATPQSGLLIHADDGKGTQMDFGYQRVRPRPGILRRDTILARLTTQSTGKGSITYSYEYGTPVWHSLGNFLVGFSSVTRVAPALSELVEFFNDDDVSGVVAATIDRDQVTPDIERFSRNSQVRVSFHGVPWQRHLSAESGYRAAGGRSVLSTRVDFEAWERGACPVRVTTTLPDATLRTDETLATVPALIDELQCLPASRRLVGRHNDSSLDFEYNFAIARDNRGQVTQVTQSAGGSSLVLESNSYDSLGRLTSQGAPGRGTTTLVYDTLGRLTQVVAADGVVMRAGGIDPLTDAVRDLEDDRGTTTRHGFDYDGFERLAASWDSASGTTRATPARVLQYRFASLAQPGAISTTTLVDGSRGANRREVSLQGADGEELASAHWVGRWSFDALHLRDQASLLRVTYDRAPIEGLEGAVSAKLNELYGQGAVALFSSVGAGFGFESDVSRRHAEEATGRTRTKWTMGTGELLENDAENGVAVRELGRDAAGRVVRQRDALGVEYRYAYDALGRLVQVMTPTGRHWLRYDAYGRPGRVSRTGLQSVAYAYDAESGLLVGKSFYDGDERLSRTEVSSYDSIGRPLQTAAALVGQSAMAVSYVYDGQGAGAAGDVAAGQRGRLSTVRGADYERRNLYDGLGRLVSSQVLLGNGWRVLEIAKRYFADGTPAGDTYTVKNGAGEVLEQVMLAAEVDSLGRVTRGLLGGQTLYTVAYDDRGRVASAALSDGHVLSFEYDPLTQRLRGRSLEGQVVSAGVSQRRDSFGRVAGELYTQGASTRERVYGYSARDELLSATSANGSAVFSYSASGRPYDVRDELGQRRVSPDGNQLDVGGERYVWDSLGRVVSRGATSFEYDARGDLAVARTGARTIRFAYDDEHGRILKLVDGVPVRATVDGVVLTTEGLVIPLEVGGAIVGVVAHGRYQALATDLNGSFITDEAGAQSLASPYGMRVNRGAFAETIDFARRGYDSDLGTVRMGVRDYDPRLSQFWTPDPLFLEQLERCRDSLRECNLYGYARNNPLSFVDPKGTQAQPANRYGVTLLSAPRERHYRVSLTKEVAPLSLKARGPVNTTSRAISPYDRDSDPCARHACMGQGNGSARRMTTKELEDLNPAKRIVQGAAAIAQGMITNAMWLAEVNGWIKPVDREFEDGVTQIEKGLRDGLEEHNTLKEGYSPSPTNPRPPGIGGPPGEGYGRIPAPLPMRYPGFGAPSPMPMRR